MSKKARKVVSIDIELDKFEPIHLKLAEAKELYEQLHELFGKEIEHVHHYDRRWYQPYYTFTNAGPVVYGNSTSDDTFTGTVTSANTNMAVTYNDH